MKTGAFQTLTSFFSPTPSLQYVHQGRCIKGWSQYQEESLQDLLTKEFPQWKLQLVSFTASYLDNDHKHIIESYLLLTAIWSRAGVLHQEELGHRGPSHWGITVVNHVNWTGSASFGEGEMFIDVLYMSLFDMGL